MANLRKQLNSLKLIIRAKDEETVSLKQNRLFSKLFNLENEYKIRLEEITMIKQNNDFLQAKIQE